MRIEYNDFLMNTMKAVVNNLRFIPLIIGEHTVKICRSLILPCLRQIQVRRTINTGILVSQYRSTGIMYPYAYSSGTLLYLYVRQEIGNRNPTGLIGSTIYYTSIYCTSTVLLVRVVRLHWSSYYTCTVLVLMLYKYRYRTTYPVPVRVPYRYEYEYL